VIHFSRRQNLFAKKPAQEQTPQPKSYYAEVSQMPNNTLTRYNSSGTDLSYSGYSAYSGTNSLSNYNSNFTQALSISNLHEQGRALLTSTALESVGALSAMEGYLCQVAPSGAHRYKLLIDACASAMANSILDW
jgi:hypothetical protein